MRKPRSPIVGSFAEVGRLFSLVRGDRTVILFGTLYGSIALTTILVFIVGRLFRYSVPAANSIADVIGLTADGGFAEILGYGAAFIATANFLVAYLDHRARVLVFLSVLMLYIGLDDSLGYHEHVGLQIAGGLDLSPMLGLNTQDMGELLAWALACIPLGFLFLWVVARMGRKDIAILILSLAPLALLVFSGVILDMFHSIASGMASRVLGVLEDGGELISLISIATISLGVARNSVVYFARSAGDEIEIL